MKKMKVIIPIALVAVFVIWMVITLSSNKKTIDQNAKQTETIIARIPVSVEKVESQIIGSNLDLIGTFEARKEINVIAEMQGRVSSIRVNEGQSISKGQIIATINDATIKSQLATANANLEKAKKDMERYENLLSVGAISLTQYEEISLGLKKQETNVTSIKQQLNYSIIRSPMSGIVKEVFLEEGSFANLGTAILDVVDINNMKIIVKVDEKDIVKLKENQKVKIATEVYPSVELLGTVSQIGVQADEARKYTITVELPNSKQNPLKAGMYGTVNIPNLSDKYKEPVLTIPRKSLIRSLKQPMVYIASNGKAKLVKVSVGRTVKDRVIILDGLKLDDRVITTGQLNLDDGREIEVIANNNLETNNKK